MIALYTFIVPFIFLTDVAAFDVTTTTTINVTTLDVIKTNYDLCVKNCKCFSDTIRCVNNGFYAINARTMIDSAFIRVFIEFYNNTILNGGRLNSGNRIISFSLNRSPIKLLDGDFFSGESNIEYLDLSFNRIETVHTTTFRFMLGLKTLNISNNPITTIAGGWMFDGKPLQNLQLLNIANTLLTQQKQLLNFGRLPYKIQQFKLCVSRTRYRLSAFMYTCDCQTAKIDRELCAIVQYINNDSDTCTAITNTDDYDAALFCNRDYFEIPIARANDGSKNTEEPKTFGNGENEEPHIDRTNAVVEMRDGSFIIKYILFTLLLLLIIVACTAVCFKIYKIRCPPFTDFCTCYRNRQRRERLNDLRKRLASASGRLTHEDLTFLQQHPEIRRPVVTNRVSVYNENYNPNYYLTPVKVDAVTAAKALTDAMIASPLSTLYSVSDTRDATTTYEQNATSVTSTDDYAYDDYFGSDFDDDDDDDECTEYYNLNRNNDTDFTKIVSKNYTFRDVPLPPEPLSALTVADDAIYSEIVE